MVVLLVAGSLWATAAEREPHIGYVYPAGGRRGTTLEVLVGGQFLRGAEEVYVSGRGVEGKVVRYYNLRMNVNREQRMLLLATLAELRQKRAEELKKSGREAQIPRYLLPRKNKNNKNKKPEQSGEPVELPEHPLLRDLESMNLRQLQQVHRLFLDRTTIGRNQPNAQLEEVVLIQVTVGQDAQPGNREIRLGSNQGITNPMPFQVGTLPEVMEQEVNDPEEFPFLPPRRTLDLPVLVNGQMLPGDVDRLRFRAKAGQRLVIEAHARRLVPFLADAVPGWFQATLALFDADGREVAYTDDWRFHPDPVLLFEVPRDGEYEVEIRDAIFRGREDFVYRLSIGELPFVTQIFPLGGREGSEVEARITGWNLDAARVRLDTDPEGDPVRRMRVSHNGHISNDICYDVDSLPEIVEKEPNEGKAQRITLPLIVNGRIERAGDVDVFEFEGKAGERVVAEVVARRLHSPLDSLLRVMDASGKVLDWNDDYVYKSGHLHTDMGILTHHADSYLMVELPADGVYRVQVSDVRNHGGPAYAYRLRISSPRPDFTLHVSPCAVTVRPGSVVPIAVHVLRKDGFEGAIEIAPRDPQSSFTVEGNRIPPGLDSIPMTLRPKQNAEEGRLNLALRGRVEVEGEVVRRPVKPCEDVMQAFLWRHLVPTEEFLVCVTKKAWQTFPGVLETPTPLRVPAGGTVPVRVGRVWGRGARAVFLSPQGAPGGISVEGAQIEGSEITFQLSADGGKLPVGYADNLLLGITVEREITRKDKDGKQQTIVRKTSFGVLPVIPFVIVEPGGQSI